MRPLFTMLLLLAMARHCVAIDKSINKSRALTEYYHYIYGAEKAIVNVDYKWAAQKYDRAFTAIPVPFAADIYNNLLVGLNIHDDARVLEMSKLLIVKGIDTGFFRKCIFTEFRKTKHWQTLLKAYPGLRGIHNKNTDKWLQERLQGMLDADQAFTAATIKNPNDAAVKHKSDSLYAAFKTLMLNNDYLSEEKVGLECADTEMSVYHDYNVLFFNSFNDKNYTLLEPLKTAIHEGKIRAPYGMMILAQLDIYNYNKDYWAYVDTLYCYNRQKLQPPAGQMQLLSEQPSDDVVAFREYCYIDSPANIVEKIKFEFQEFCRFAHHIHTNPFRDFQLQVGPGHINGSNSDSIIWETMTSKVVATFDNY